MTTQTLTTTIRHELICSSQLVNYKKKPKVDQILQAPDGTLWIINKIGKGTKVWINRTFPGQKVDNKFNFPSSIKGNRLQQSISYCYG